MLPVLRRSNWPGTPFDEQFCRLVNQADSMFEQFLGNDGAIQRVAWAGLPMAMWEDEDHFIIEAELPGLAENEVEVTVHNGMLFIRGERRVEQGRKYLYNTRSHGRFERVVALPDTVDPDHVNATLRLGVLHVELTKSVQAKPRKIAVKEG
jgi:HSP20 family protein